jgi:LacI family transcriptional regulator
LIDFDQIMTKPLKIMLLIENSRAFGRNLLRGISRYVRLHGPWEIYRVPPFYRDPYGKETALAMIHEWGADGLILRENQGFKDKIPQGIPTVISSESEEYIPGCGHVIGEHEDIGKMGAEHLLQLGFKNFAYCGFEDIYWSRMRHRGFCKTIENAGFNANLYKQPPIAASLLWEKEQQCIVDWLKTLPPSTGLMACADERSEQVLQACKSAGRKVPDDIAIIGADDDEMICDFCYPALSSIAFNTQQVGFEAAELLEKMIRSDVQQDQRKVILKPTRVHPRQSTNIMAVEDPAIARALKFILNNCDQSLSVDTVAGEAAVSRRMLERKFKRSLGISVYKQIVIARTEKVIQLLIETELSVSQIADRLSFTNHQQIARYFQQHKGITPTQFRKQARQEIRQ